MPSWCRRWLYAPPLQLQGGLRIARQTWMAGAGPTVLVRATDVTTVYIDGCPYEVVERQVTPAQAPLLEQPGRHIIQIAHSAGLQFEVKHGDALPERCIVGWILHDQTWPSREWQEKLSENLLSTALRVQGPVISGRGQQETDSERPLQRQWLQLAVQLRGGRMHKQDSSLTQMDKVSHPLVRQMHQIIEPGLPWFSRMTKG
jgi:hypothetical protein